MYTHSGKRLPEAEVEIQPLPKKIKSATRVPQKKKHETSSSSEEASKSEEEEVSNAFFRLLAMIAINSRIYLFVRGLMPRLKKL